MVKADKIGYLAPSTWKRYRVLWNEFEVFSTNVLLKEGILTNCEDIELFIVYLWNYKKLSVSHIRLYLAALAAHFKLEEVEDHTKNFGIGALLKSYSKVNKPIKVRNPISRSMLSDICSALKFIIKDKNDVCLYSLLFQTMFWFALCISEVTRSSHNIGYKQVTYDNNSEALKVKLLSYKFSKGNIANLEVPCKRTSGLYSLLYKYLKERGTRKDPFLIQNGRALNSKTVTQVLKDAINYLGQNPDSYGSHSLRIGRGTDLALRGTSVIKIKKFGRWSTNAYMVYIKPNSVVCD